MPKKIENAFMSLAETSQRHHDLQRMGAPVAELWQSRCDLDDARLKAAKATRQLASV